MKEPAPLHDRLSDGPVGFSNDTIIHAPLEKVWEAATQAAHLAKFFGMKPQVPLSEPGVRIVDWDGYDPDLTDVRDVKPRELIQFQWNAWKQPYRTICEFRFAETDDGVKFTIAERGWELTQRGVESALANCEGWTSFAIRLKMYVQHGIESDTEKAC